MFLEVSLGLSGKALGETIEFILRIILESEP